MTKIISIVNQKGGVGKTTTSINLAATLALAGKKTLLIDIDPQANCTSGIGVKREEIIQTIKDVFFKQEIAEGVILKTNYLNLSIIASEIDLVSVDLELINAPEKEAIIKKTLAKIKQEYDYIIFDCPPALNLLTLNALNASDSVLIPVQCEYFALEGLTQLLQVYELVKKSLNPELEIEGFLLTMADKKQALSNSVSDEVRSHFEDKVFKTVIHRDISLGQAPSFGSPIVYYNPRCQGAKDYMALAEELIKGGKSICSQAF